MNIFKIFARRWEFVTGATIVIFFILVSFAAPMLAPRGHAAGEAAGTTSDFRTVGTTRVKLPTPPGELAVLGTTGNRWDVFYTLIWGTRDALNFGIIVAGCSALLGIVLGLLSGTFGGWVHQLIMRITDGFLTFPLIAAILITHSMKALAMNLLLANIPPESFYDPMFVTPSLPWYLNALLSTEFTFILFSWMPYARITDALALRLRSSEFIEASTAVGSSRISILLHHILPNVVSPSIVLLSRDMGGVVLTQAALTFINFGGSHGSLWGTLLDAGRDYIMGTKGNPFQYWWVFIPVSLMIILFGVGWSLLGDGLNDLLNPRKRSLRV